jgi:hypothetical protein
MSLSLMFLWLTRASIISDAVLWLKHIAIRRVSVGTARIVGTARLPHISQYWQSAASDTRIPRMA